MSNTLHNAIMEAGSKDRPPMLAPGWKTKPILDSDGNPTTSTERVCETYKTVTQEIRDQLNAEAEAVQIILTGIDNDIYSTVDACPNACEMWKAIERLKQGVINTCDLLEKEFIWKYCSPFKTAKKLEEIRNFKQVMYETFYQACKRSAGYENQRFGNVAGARETVGSTAVQKSRIQCYNCKEFRHAARECQKPKRVKDAAYHKEKMLMCKQKEAGIQLNAEQADWRDDTDDDELED
nr:RNA-directed DNA polymerase, eukaryota [Tanacetum cinerariifolium]